MPRLIRISAPLHLHVRQTKQRPTFGSTQERAYVPTHERTNSYTQERAYVPTHERAQNNVIRRNNTTIYTQARVFRTSATSTPSITTRTTTITSTNKKPRNMSAAERLKVVQRAIAKRKRSGCGCNRG